MEGPKNGCFFFVEYPIKLDDLGARGTPISGNLHMKHAISCLMEMVMILSEDWSMTSEVMFAKMDN